MYLLVYSLYFGAGFEGGVGRLGLRGFKVSGLASIVAFSEAPILVHRLPYRVLTGGGFMGGRFLRNLREA